jgi:uncharacterized protein YcnI
MKRKAAAALVAAVALGLPGAAEAHVSLHPNTLPAGSFPTVDIRVPSEEPSASTTEIAVQFPPGFIDVSTGYLPGWTVTKKTRKLAKPVTTDAGTVNEEVSEVIWSGGKVPPEYFLNLPISIAIPDGDVGKALTFKTVQTYSNGKVVRWIGPASSDQPAPTVNVTQKGGVIEDVAGTEAGPGSPQSTSQPVSASSSTKSSSKGASKGLGIAALVVGIVALIAGLIALALALGRRSRTGTAGP